jgi:hypothetical protein
VRTEISIPIAAGECRLDVDTLRPTGSQPSNLPPDFGDEAGYQKAVGNGRLEPANRCVACIAVNRIVVSRNLRELTNIVI